MGGSRDTRDTPHRNPSIQQRTTNYWQPILDIKRMAKQEEQLYCNSIQNSRRRSQTWWQNYNPWTNSLHRKV
ncbi:hypothetical protein Ptr86124_013924 [Pyrenophora tritici-repentis]|uniref:Uncharacterized protein n=1 Tax=Pyrenophora tritici-repentis TaxID=45151 RepID=A0A922N1E7_9PLEO|nr:hypothetical protein Ptr86124_013924 [Pyrenophora tritici-repentis]